MTTDHDTCSLPRESAMFHIPPCLWAVTRHVYDPYTDCHGEPDAPGLTLDELLSLEHTLVIHLDPDVAFVVLPGVGR